MDYLAFILSLFLCALVSSDGNIKENEPTDSVTLSDIMNGILNVRIDLLSLKDKVNSNMNAIVNVDKKVESNAKTIQKMVRQVQTHVVFVQDQVNDNSKGINGFGGVVALSEGGHVVKKYYNDYNISFIGYGSSPYSDDSVLKLGVSFSQCLEHCHTVREERGTTWDDFVYYLPSKYCSCHQRGTGHDINKDYLHYHFF